MTEGRSRPKARFVGRALLTVLIGMLAGGGLNALLGEKGADTPSLALLGGAIAPVAWSCGLDWRARDSQDPSD